MVEGTQTANWIIMHEDHTNSYFGPLASPYAFKRGLQKRLKQCFNAKLRMEGAGVGYINRYFVLEGTIVRAAQATLEGAKQYMADDRVLVEVE